MPRASRLISPEPNVRSGCSSRGNALCCSQHRRHERLPAGAPRSLFCQQVIVIVECATAKIRTPESVLWVVDELPVAARGKTDSTALRKPVNPSPQTISTSCTLRALRSLKTLSQKRAPSNVTLVTLPGTWPGKDPAAFRQTYQFATYQLHPTRPILKMGCRPASTCSQWKANWYSRSKASTSAFWTRFVMPSDGPPRMTAGSSRSVSYCCFQPRRAMRGCWIPKITWPLASHKMAILSPSILEIPRQASLWNGRVNIELTAPPSAMQTSVPEQS
jgi:hypothetical protein